MSNEKTSLPMRPAPLPKCRHGITLGYRYCSECQNENEHIRLSVKPLVDEFWEHRGERDLEHLFARAYYMGMEHATAEADEKQPAPTAT